MKYSPVGERVSKWGEGPIFWEGALYYVDIEGHAVVRLDPATGEEKVWPVGQRVGLVVPRRDGGLLAAGDKGFFCLNEETGETVAITDPEPDLPDNRFNDGKCSPDGYLFAGTISLVKKEGSAALYRLSPDGEATRVLGGLTNSNGIAWSLDGKTVYHIDTPRRSVWAYPYSNGEIEVQAGREVIDTGAIDASPDGMTIDAEGKLWVAFCHGACVVRYCPDSGESLRKIDLPCLETTAPAFGGENLEKLYVTTGIHKSEVEELAGRVLEISDPGVCGIESYPYGG